MQLARRRGVRAALLYAHWFPGFPPAFAPVAVLRRTKRTITAGGDEVTVYAIGREARASVVRALGAFAPTLPAGVRLEFVAEPRAHRPAKTGH
jgi:hypothetical protein